MLKTKRLAIYSPQLSIDPESGLGGCVSDRETLRALADAGATVTIPLPEGEPTGDSVEGWEFMRVQRRRSRWYYGYSWKFRRLLWQIARSNKNDARRPWRKFNVVRVHSAHSVGWGLLGAARRLGIPTHLEYYHHEPGGWLRNAIEAATLHRYDLITTPSVWTHNDLLRRFPRVAPERVRVVTQGIPRRTLCHIAPRRHPGVTRLRLLHVGAAIPRKNVSFLLYVVAWMQETYPEIKARLHVVGEMTQEREAELKALARGLELKESCIIVGPVSREWMCGYYRMADIFVSASVREGFGMAIGEAMTAGLPVVAFHASAVPELVVDGETGRLVEPGDIKAFAQAVVAIAQQPEMAQRMGEAGARRARRYTFAQKAKELMDIYWDLRGSRNDGNAPTEPAKKRATAAPTAFHAVGPCV